MIAPQKKFWTKERIGTTLGLGAESAVDGVATQKWLHNPGVVDAREMNPLARPLVTRGTGGQVAASILGPAAVVGAQYLVHTTGHEKAADWIGRVALGGEGVNAARLGSMVASIPKQK
jgi:hypothetical protein